MHIYSEGTGSGENQMILAKTNDLVIVNQQDDGNIIFRTDNSAGSVQTPLTLDGDGDATFAGVINADNSTTNSLDILNLKSGANNVDEYLGLTFTTGVGGSGPHGAIRVYNGPSASDAYMSFLTTTNGGTLTAGLTLDHLGVATFSDAVIIDKLGSHGRIRAGSSMFVGGGGTTSLVQFSADAIPDADSSHDLGSSTRYWRNAYIDTVTTTGAGTFGGRITHPHKKYCNASIANSYVRVYFADDGTNSQMGTIVRLTGTSHGTSHVGSFTALITVSHYQDVQIKSTNSFYGDDTGGATLPVLKVESDNNGSYTLSMKVASSTNAATYYFTIEALSSETTITTLPSSTASTSTTHEHTMISGSHTTGRGGNVVSKITGDLHIKQDDDSGFDDGFILERSSNTQKLILSMHGGAVNFNSPDSLSYKFRANGTEKFVLDSSGNATFAGNIRTTEDIGRDDHNRIMFSTDDAITFRVADSHRFKMISDAFYPYTDSTFDLGTSSLYFRHGYIDAITTTGNVIVGGDLQVNGETTTTNVVNLDVSDNIIGLNRGATSNANDSGLIIERGSTGDNATFLWDESADSFIFGTTTANPAATGNITYAFAPIKASSATFSGTVTADNIVKATNSGTENALLQASATGTGYAGMYLDASNGDFSGNDYFSIRQLNDLSVEFDVRASAGVTVFKSKGSTNLTMDGTGATFAGVVTWSGGNSTNANTAYGWGNHASAGYQTSTGSVLNLNAIDDRDMAPEDRSYSDDLRIFFSSREGLEDGSSTSSDWQDVLFLNSYSDSSGGNANILAFDKNSYTIRHYQAGLSASNWGTAKTLAYLQAPVFEGSITVGGDITATGADMSIAHAGGPEVSLRRDDTSIGDGDRLGMIQFQGDDPTDGTFVSGAGIAAKANGAWGSGNATTRMEFYTRNTSGGLNTAQTIEANGNVNFSYEVGIPEYLRHSGDTDTYLRFETNNIVLSAGAAGYIQLESDGDIQLVPEYTTDDAIHYIELGRVAGSNGGSSTGDNPVHVTVIGGYSVDYSGGTRLANEGFLMWHSGGGWTGNQRHWAMTNAYDISGSGGPKFALLLGDNNTTEPTLGSNGQLGTNTSVATYWKNDKSLIHQGHITTVGLHSGSGTVSFADGSSTFDSSDAQGYARFTQTNGSAQIGLFRSGGSAGGVHIGGDSGGFNMYASTDAAGTFGANILEVDMSGNMILDGGATFGGSVYMGNTVVNPASGFADQTGIGLKYSTTVPELQVSSDSTAMQLGRTSTGGSGQIMVMRAASTTVHDFRTTYYSTTGWVDAANFKIGGAQGSDGQVLTSTGSGVAWETPSTGSTFTGGTVANATTFSSNVTFESEETILKGGSPELYFHTTGNHANWMIAAQECCNATLEFGAVAASTSLSTDASTYTPVLKLGQGGDAIFAGTITNVGSITTKASGASNHIIAQYQRTDGNNVATLRTTDSGHVFRVHAQNAGTIYVQNDDGSNYLKIPDSGNNELVGNTAVTGDVVISSAGTGDSPCLRINNLSHTTFNHGIEVYNGNLVQGESEILLVGKTGATKNAGYLGYYWHAANSDDNFVTIGHYGNNHIFRVYGSGSVWAGTNMQAPIFYDASATSYYVDPGGNTVLAGDITLGTSSTNSTTTIYGNTNNLVLRSQASGTRAPELKFNIDGTDVGALTLHNNTSGIATNTLAYSISGTPKHYFYSDGNFQTVGYSTCTMFRDSNNTSYYLDPNSTGTSLNVAGNISHTGLTPTAGTDIDQIYTASVSLTVTTAWQDTTVNATELATGTYIVQVYTDDHGTNSIGHYTEYYSGIMSWYSTNTNSTDTDEIILHRAGHAPNHGDIFLRTERTASADTSDMNLQIKTSNNASGAATYVFKFRRMI